MYVRVTQTLSFGLSNTYMLCKHTHKKKKKEKNRNSVNYDNGISNGCRPWQININDSVILKHDIICFSSPFCIQQIIYQCMCICLDKSRDIK